MNVAVTLYTKRSSWDSDVSEPVILSTYGDRATIDVGGRELVVDKAELIAAVRILEMAVE
jgi:hypothetical protein